MADALVGCTGFVGSNLRSARSFDGLFHSRNIAAMAGSHFDEVWFCGLPATKWAINRDPAADLANMNAIQQVLEQVHCSRFVLISTIDVLHDTGPYGEHRGMFERWAQQRFRSCCIVRLPGLFGPGLKKNVLFDLLTGNRLESVHADDAYQWYDLRDLLADIELVRSHGVECADLFPEPVENRALFDLFADFKPAMQQRPPRRYDFPSAQAALFGRERFIRSADDVRARIARFVTEWRASSPAGA